jgi:phosphatidylserine decarboxylase
MRFRVQRGCGLRVPLTSYGLATALVVSGAFVALTIVCAFLVGPYALILLAPAFFVFYFFRDPERRPAEDCAGTVISPADGKLIGIREAEMPIVGGKAAVLDIFLSVFDVHVNRAPLAGKVLQVVYKEGEFRNALRQAAGDVNESNTVLMETLGGTKVAVKQISGVIARRIVCGVREGTELACGERFGMIKFGSRTQVFIPVEAGFKPLARIGDHVKGGETVLGHLG